MHKLQKLNVIKIVDNENSKDKLITQGYKVVNEINDVQSIDYSALTVDKLKEITKEKGLEGYSNMKKEELVAALKELDNVK
ncbi:Rho termination factor N-terminal domain-containing protein [Clostridium weizhouense]|uniref:Rho termination factor N-terminal domain-containing protein n=1 Tax=Clostridium weizhouense TaxID=2859781 RepID=A0ABS7AJY8_9CLOT|nr:Rho termination factor N-terminal domain-containing protein [Clostridium weizhouense]MBW6408974.1 Rho termination factor N-terminal domain-containing protein [Clostridium weizhouense]